MHRRAAILQKMTLEEGVKADNTESPKQNNKQIGTGKH